MLSKYPECFVVPVELVENTVSQLLLPTITASWHLGERTQQVKTSQPRLCGKPQRRILHASFLHTFLPIGKLLICSVLNNVTSNKEPLNRKKATQSPESLSAQICWNFMFFFFLCLNCMVFMCQFYVVASLWLQPG